VAASTKPWPDDWGPISVQPSSVPAPPRNRDFTSFCLVLKPHGGHVTQPGPPKVHFPSRPSANHLANPRSRITTFDRHYVAPALPPVVAPKPTSLQRSWTASFSPKYVNTFARIHGAPGRPRDVFKRGLSRSSTSRASENSLGYLFRMTKGPGLLCSAYGHIM
jgi:hypothetical protein